LRDGTIGDVHQPDEAIRFPSLEQAVAAYVVRELDFWLEFSPTDIRKRPTSA
jgi:hypothetical protein